MLNSSPSTRFTMLAILAIFIAINPIDAIAQSKWKPGYILTRSNDTLRGLVKRNKLYQREFVELKSAETGKKKPFKSKEVKRFVCGDETYRSFFIPMRVAPYEIFVTIKKDKGFHFFVRVMTEGKYNVYAYEYAFNSKVTPRSVIIEASREKNMEVFPGRFKAQFLTQKKMMKDFFKEDERVMDYLNQEVINFEGFLEVIRGINQED